MWLRQKGTWKRGIWSGMWRLVAYFENASNTAR